MTTTRRHLVEADLVSIIAEYQASTGRSARHASCEDLWDLALDLGYDPIDGDAVALMEAAAR